MYRVCLRRCGRGNVIAGAPRIFKPGNPLGKVSARYDSTDSSGGSGLLFKYIAGTLIGIGAGSVGVIGYAGYDDHFRTELALQHEYLETMLDSLYGKQGVTKDRKVPHKPKRNGEDHRPTRKYTDEVVVVTTMDHQPGVSSVDIDISNMEGTQERWRAQGRSKGNDDSSSSSAGSGGEVLEVEAKEPVEDAPEKDSSDAAEVAELQEPAQNEGTQETLATVGTETETASALIEEPKYSTEKENEAPAGDLEVAENLQLATPETDVEAGEVLQTASPDTKLVDAVQEVVDIQTVDEVSLAEAELNRSKAEKETIEALLQVSIDKLVAESQEVINAQKRAAGSIYTYVSQLGNALAVPENDATFFDTWRITSELEKESQGAIDAAKAEETGMQEKIDAVLGMISAVRKFGDSEIANKAQEVSSIVSLKIQRAAEDIKKATTDFASMVEYHTLAAKAKSEFQKGLDQLADETAGAVQAGDDADTPKDGTNALLIYALKKVDFLTRTLGLRDKEEQERLVVALEKQREEEEKRYHDLMEEEIKRVQAENKLEQEKKEIQVISQYEGEMRKQLKRQASAHREHLSDVLNLQASELEAKHKDIMEARLRDQHRIYEDELEVKTAFLQGVESGVDAVVDVEEENKKTRALWLAIQSLFSALREPLLGGRSRALMAEVVAVECASGGNGEIKEAVSTIPSSALVKGVVTERELNSRFQKVKKVCHHVAMVGEEGGSLFSYALSYLRSLLVFESAYSKSVDEVIDVNDINTYEILIKAENCLKLGDLEQAVKFMNLLRGLPRKVAKDWLEEAKNYLETRQAVNFMLALARSRGTDQTSS